MIQILLNFLVLGVVVRLIIDSARRRSSQIRAAESEGSGGPPAGREP